MAYTSTELTSKQYSDFDKDYPILVGNNVFDHRHLTEARWTAGAGKDISDSDVTDPSFPFYQVAGRDPSTISKTAGVSHTHDLHFDPVGDFTENFILSAGSYSATAYDTAHLDHIRPGMYVRDDGTGRFVTRGTRVVTKTPPSFLMTNTALAADSSHAVTISGRKGAVKAELDSFFVFNHNMHRDTANGGVSGLDYTLRLRDHQTGSSTAVTGGSPLNRKPIISFLLNGSGGAGTEMRKYEGVKALSLRLTDPSIGSTTDYYAGSVWGGVRWQLPRWPDKPYDDRGTSSGASDHMGLNGFMTRHSTWQGRAFRRWSIPLSSDEDISNCEAFRRGCGYLTKPFVLVENPSTSPKAYVMQAEAAAVVFPKSGKHEQVFTITMVEKPPFYSTY